MGLDFTHINGKTNIAAEIRHIYTFLKNFP
jgi:hypothetical protein